MIEGQIKKKTHMLPGYQKRHFILTDTFLKYYPRSKEGEVEQ